jgi:hypothetical protein
MMISLKLMAETNDEPIGIEKMLNTFSQVNRPQDIIGSTFLLETPEGFEKKVLHILPENAAETTFLGNGNYRIRILKADAFYDMDFYNDTGSISVKEIRYSWTDKVLTDVIVNNKQECVSKIKFIINGKEFTQENLNKYKTSQTPYRFDFNRSILKQSSENDFVFTRLSNEPVAVTLTLFKKDGSIFTKMESDQVAVCSNIPAPTPAPRLPIWGSWSDFNECSVTCGGGKQSRTRTCETDSIGIPCIGNAYEERACNTYACKTPVMTEEQKQKLRYHSVGLNIVKATKLTMLNPKGTATYEASVSNPFGNKIRCDIVIISSRGINEEAQNIDQKTHFGIEVAPHGQTKVTGQINIMKGRGNTTGLEWTAYTAQYTAENCDFIN